MAESVLSPVLLTNTNGPCSPALPPVVTVPLLESPELQFARLISASPNMAVFAPVMTVVRFIISFMRTSFLMYF
jgi:hypothetical protein